MDMGKAIRDLRLKGGYSQDKLVAKTGISRSQLYFIESGRCVPRIENNREDRVSSCNESF